MPTHAPRPVRHLAAALAGAALLALAAPAAAVTLAVTRLDDPAPDGCFPNDCSLREAVILANALAGADTVVLGAGMFQLTRAGAGEDAGLTGDLDVAGPLTIQGAGRTQTTIVGVTLGDRLLDASADLDVRDLGLEGGVASSDWGGGLRAGRNLTLERVTIANNSADRGGGVAWMTNGWTLSVRDSSFSGNAATFAGGGIAMLAGAARVERSTFSANTASAQGGGGILVMNTNPGATAWLELVDSVFELNTADAGGAVASWSGAPYPNDPEAGVRLRVVRSTFTLNTAWGTGGAISFWRQGYGGAEQLLEVEEGAFDRNSSGSAGGAVAVGVGRAVIDGAELVGNTAPSGGGLYVGPEIGPASAQVFRSSFVDNDAVSGSGGGVYSRGGLEVRRSSFVGNTAALDGGGVLAGGGTVVARSTFSANQAAGAGGGLWAGDALVQVFASTFRANTAGSGGAALHGGATTFGNQLRYSGNVISGTCGGGAFVYVTDGWNVESPGATCAPFGAATGDLLSVADGSLGLGALQTDGRTWFYVPGAGSVVRDRAAACADVDQRGYVAGDSACDGGSIEVGATFPSFFDDGFETGLGAWSASQGG